MQLIDPFPLLTDLKEAMYTDDEPSMVLTNAGKQIWNATIEFVASKVKEQTVIDAEPVRHGRWEWYEDWGPSTWLEPPDCLAAEWRCGACKTNLADYMEQHSPGEHVYMDNSELKPTLAYCPNCGAKMDLKEENT